MANTVINTPELLNLDSTTGATVLAKGTISERPTGSAAIDGTLRFNTNTNKTEYFDGTGWYEIVDEYANGFIGPATNYFDTKLYTGNGSTQSISTLNFAPDLVWIKARSVGYSHSLQDTLRGPGTSTSIYPDLSSAAGTYGAYGQISAFGTDGFTVASGGHGSYPTAQVNQNGVTYASWNWKAGGAAVTNNDGTIAGQVSANKDSGFSIVRYNGNSTAGATIGTGLSSAAQLIIVKSLNTIGGSSKAWTVYAEPLGNTDYLYLNTSAQALTYNFWNNTSPTNTVFSVSSDSNVNSSSGEYIAYCWHSIAGYSSIGTYSGNSSTKKIDLDFAPSWVMIKCTNVAGGNWFIYDNKRNPANPADLQLEADTPAADTDHGTAYELDFLSDGFELQGAGGAVNYSGRNYLYMAFA